jgi:nicotinate-nucleotide pyrophosphorylase (carboxylating)
MSGITTITRTYADTLIKSGSKTKVAATRKTAPGMMRLDKKAVLLGGGVTHRMGLYDMILFKDNHLKLFCGDVKAVLASVKKAKTRLKVEIEVSSIKDALIAAENGADMIMFDNMRPPQIREAVDLLKAKGLRKKVLLEASGGVNLDNIVLYGQAGVDWISVGRITNSSQALDYTLEVLE